MELNFEANELNKIKVLKVVGFFLDIFFLLISRECAPPYPQRDRKRRLNGAVCRNHRIKRLVPCRC